MAFLLGWVTAERAYLSKQSTCPAIGGGSQVTFKSLISRHLEGKVYEEKPGSRQELGKNTQSTFNFPKTTNYINNLLTFQLLRPKPNFNGLKVQKASLQHVFSIKLLGYYNGLFNDNVYISIGGRPLLPYHYRPVCLTTTK
ncbi:hypothetical protein J6590_041814 [Homalodisca vitripennis]|nr:hypothetical protein J6590_041814 [Homalodisca vitripennis]